MRTKPTTGRWRALAELIGKPPRVDDAPGLAWRPRADHWVAVWLCRQDIALAGYPLKTQRIWPPMNDTGAVLTDDVTDGIRRECQRLHDEMLAWHLGGPVSATLTYNRRLSGLIERYQRDPDSPYRALRHISRRGYDKHLLALERNVGERLVSELGARDFTRWFENWSAPSDGETRRHVPRAKARIKMLRILFGFGVVYEYDYQHCLRLKTILHEMRFEGGKSRTAEITAEQAIAVRERANATGRQSIALAQALQFELVLRQKDVIGEWAPVDEPGLSDIHKRGRKWMLGIDWREVSPDLVLTHRLSKSVRGRRAVADMASGKTKVFDLKLYPMVMEEIARIPVAQRVGPMIIDEHTGMPYWPDEFRKRWRKIATQVGIPRDVQNRDSRAGGLTEGIEASDGDMEAARNAAGHSRQATTQIYNRGEHRQTAKIAVLRASKREQK